MQTMLKSDEAEVRKTDLSYRNDEQVVPLLVSHRRSAVSHRLFFNMASEASLKKRHYGKIIRKHYTKNAISNEKG